MKHTKEHCNLQKNKKGFFLFEVIVSLVILSVVISGFSHILISNSSYSLYNKLQTMENNFYQYGKITNNNKINFVQHL
jgi:Tfp pilus assembly protein PilV